MTRVWGQRQILFGTSRTTTLRSIEPTPGPTDDRPERWGPVGFLGAPARVAVLVIGAVFIVALVALLVVLAWRGGDVGAHQARPDSPVAGRAGPLWVTVDDVAVDDVAVDGAAVADVAVSAPAPAATGGLTRG